VIATTQKPESIDKKQAAGAIDPTLAQSPSADARSVAKTKISVKMSSVIELRTVK